MANILDFGGVRALTSNAQPGAGYVAEFYVSGTTTPVTVYTDSTLGTAHGTSVTADSAGRFAAVWSSGGAVKCIIKDADGATVQTIDPVISVAGGESDAASITFTPTVELPFTNVQDAIEGAVAAAASGYAAFGIGITGNAELLANLDATNIGAGVYRFDGTTTGTYPTGVAAADTGLVEHWRQAGATAMQFLYHATTDRIFHRRMASTTWGTWREVATVNTGATQGQIIRRGASDWERGAAVTPITASGGTLTDLNGTPNNRLSVSFVATGPFVMLAAGIGVNHQSATATDVVADLRLYDTVALSNVVTAAGGETATGNQGYAVRFGVNLSYNSLTVGRTYEAQLWLSKTIAVGPTLPRDLRIDGFTA